MTVNKMALTIIIVLAILVLAGVGFGTFIIGKNMGQKAGFIAGEASGLTKSAIADKGGYDKGYADGLAAGENSGYDKGFDVIAQLAEQLVAYQGDQSALYEGEQVGYSDGYVQAYNDAWIAAWPAGWLAAYNYYYDLTANVNVNVDNVDVDVDTGKPSLDGIHLLDNLPEPCAVTLPTTPHTPAINIPEHQSRFGEGTGPSLPAPSLPKPTINLPRR
jgi:hypothetical protein